ncbi:MAG: hypothetical protein JWM34_1910 [Ilumatobacteraceae bacterium]|nr:hypothetical protein [Ilumatobacteraceae bacterium]
MTGEWNDDLWPGERPFTDFGQFGVDALDLRVFDQTDWWVDRLGRPHRLDEMTDDYRRNVIVFLTSFVDGFHAASALREAATTLGDALLGRVSYALLATDVGAPRTLDLEPISWLEATPLMRRLRALTGTA